MRGQTQELLHLGKVQHDKVILLKEDNQETDKI